MECKTEGICDSEVPSAYPIHNTSTDANVRSEVQLSLKSFFYTWAVSNFSKCLEFYDPRFYSPEFIFENTVWRLRLHVIENDGVKKISICLSRKEKGDTDFYIKNNISLFDEEGRILSVNEIETNFEGDTTVSNQIPLMSDDSESLAFFNDKLIVHCEFLVLTSHPCDDTSTSLNKTNNTCDSKLGKAVVPPPKSFDRSLVPFPQFITKRLSEKRIINYKEDLMMFLLIFVAWQCIYIGTDVAMKYNGMHNKSLNANHFIKGKEINELIIDSTIKLINIAEVLNLTDVKIKSTEILATYLRMYNNSALLVTQGDRANASVFLTSKIKVYNASDVKLPIFGVGNNPQEELDRNH